MNNVQKVYQNSGQSTTVKKYDFLIHYGTIWIPCLYFKPFQARKNEFLNQNNIEKFSENPETNISIKITVN